MAQRLFGTDGVRGTAGEGALAPEALLRLGRAIGEVARRRGLAPVALLGHDGRRSAEMIGQALGAGLLASGFDCEEVGLVTTPGLAHLTRRRKAGLGVVLSASHNPASDNGVKLFGPGGAKLPDEVEREIEACHEAGSWRKVSEIGRAREAGSLSAEYLRYLEREAVPRLRLKGLRIALDCANGAASEIGPALFRALGARVEAICAAPDGENINRGCGAVHPERVARAARRARAHLGLALDGDGDRAIFADEKGRVVDGDGAMTALGLDLLARKRLARRTVVATVMNNLGLRKALEDAGARLEIVGVGDRHVVEALQRERLSLGGEQSGHLVFGGDNDYIGDGLYTALRLLDLLRRTGKPLSELVSPFRRFPQILENVPVRAKPPLESLPRVQESLRRAERALGRSGRVLLRYSGTEPLARVMVEGPELRTVSTLARDLAEAVRRELGS